MIFFLSSLQYKPDVEVTELALAFPLPSDLKVLPLAKVCSHEVNGCTPCIASCEPM